MDFSSMQAFIWIILFGFLQFLPGSSLNAIDSPPLTTTPATTTRTTIAYVGRTATSRETPSLTLPGFVNGDDDDGDDHDDVDKTFLRIQSMEKAVESERAPKKGTQITSANADSTTNRTRTIQGEHSNAAATKTVQTPVGQSFVRQVANTTTNIATIATNNNNNSDDDDFDDNNVAVTKGIKDLFNTIVDSGETEQEIMPTTMEAWQMTTPIATTTTAAATPIRSSTTTNPSARIMKKTQDAETFGTIRYTSRARKGDEAHTKSIEGMPRYSAEPRHKTDDDAATISANAKKTSGLPEGVIESIAINSKAKSRQGQTSVEENVSEISDSAGEIGMSSTENSNDFTTTTEAFIANTEVTLNSEEISTIRNFENVEMFSTHPSDTNEPTKPSENSLTDGSENFRPETIEVQTEAFDTSTMASQPISLDVDTTYQVTSKSTTPTQPLNLEEEQPITFEDSTTTQPNNDEARPSNSKTTSKAIPTKSLEPEVNFKASFTTSKPFGAPTQTYTETLHTTFKPSPTVHKVLATNTTTTIAVAATTTTTITKPIHRESGEIVETIGQPEKLVATQMPTAAEMSEAQENNRRRSSNAVRSLKDKEHANKAGNRVDDDNGGDGKTASPEPEEQEEYVAIAVDVGGGAYEYPARLVQQPKIVYSNSNRIGNLHQQQQEAQEGRSYAYTDNGDTSSGDHMSWHQRREYVKQLHAAIAAASAGDIDQTTMRHDLLTLPLPLPLPTTPNHQHHAGDNNNNNLLIATKTSTPPLPPQTALVAISLSVADSLSSSLNSSYSAAGDDAMTPAADINGTSSPTPGPAIGEPPTTTMALPTLPKTTKRRFVVRTTTAKPPPTIDDYQTITSQAGTHAYLPCNVKQLVKKPISWLRVRDGHILTVDQTTFIADQRFQSIYTTNPERWSLQIKYVQVKDAGTYECQVSTEPKASAIVNLRIVEPRTELIGESTRHVKAGSQVKLHCIISQALEPPLFINWFYNQKQIYLHNRKGWRTEIERIDLPQAPPATPSPPPPPPATRRTTTAKLTTQTTTLKRSSSTTSSSTLNTSTTDQPMPGGVTTKSTATTAIGTGTTTTTQLSETDSKGNDGTIKALMGSHTRTASSPLTVSSPPSLSDVLTNEVDLLDNNDSSSLSSSSSSLADAYSSAAMFANGGGVTTIAAAAAMAAAAASAAAAANVVDIKQITTASLIIPSVEKLDSGNYTCSPSNSAPRTVVLHVLNGEYSASAITSGSGRNFLISHHQQHQHQHGFYQHLMQWPNIYNIIILCGLLNILVSYGSGEAIWKLSSRHTRHPVISSNYAHKEASATKMTKQAEIICKQTERILYGTFGEEYT